MPRSPIRGAGDGNRFCRRQWLQRFHDPCSRFLQFSSILPQLLSNPYPSDPTQLEESKRPSYQKSYSIRPDIRLWKESIRSMIQPQLNTLSMNSITVSLFVINQLSFFLSRIIIPVLVSFTTNCWRTICVRSYFITLIIAYLTFPALAQRIERYVLRQQTHGAPLWISALFCYLPFSRWHKGDNRCLDDHAECCKTM